MDENLKIVLKLLKARKEKIGEEILWLEEQERKHSSAVLVGKYDLALNIYNEQFDFLEKLVADIENSSQEPADQLFRGIIAGNLQEIAALPIKITGVSGDVPPGVFLSVFSNGKLWEF